MRHSVKLMYAVYVPILLIGSQLRALAQPSNRISWEYHPDSFTMTVTNSSNVSATGIFVSVEHKNAHTRVVTYKTIDSVLNFGRDRAITAGETRLVQVPHFRSGMFSTNVKLEAVVFSDGSSWGSSSGVSVLVGRRSELIKAIDTTRLVLSSIKSSGSNRVTYLTTLQELKNGNQILGSTMAERAVSVIDQIVATYVLKQAQRLNTNCTTQCLEQFSDAINNKLISWQARVAAANAINN